MNNKLSVHWDDKFIYDIYFEHNYSNLPTVLKGTNCNCKRCCIVSDSNVSEIYLEEVKNGILGCVEEVCSFVFQAGEEQKTLDTVKQLYEFLIKAEFDRNDILIALGGGVVGDLTGYASATYLRGIRFLQMPTSLLSMVDSSIGGKTGVDFDSYKNMVGAFHQPKAVYINLSVLKTLPDEQFFAGFGEIIKHGLIKDNHYYKWLINNQALIKAKDDNIMSEVVYRSCLIKKDVVEKDAFETGERALLNFGHTIGHAVEKLTHFKLLHGECVALGIVSASYISYTKGMISKKDLLEIIKLLRDYNLPITLEKINEQDMSSTQVLKATKHDKKMNSGKIKFILLDSLGEANIYETVTDEEIISAVDFITNQGEI